MQIKDDIKIILNVEFSMYKFLINSIDIKLPENTQCVYINVMLQKNIEYIHVL